MALSSASRATSLAIVLSVVGGFAFATPGRVSAQRALDDCLDAEMSPGAGLTSDQVARRAAATSPAVDARAELVRGARASVDEARAGLVPRVTLAARYTRISDPGSAELGRVVVAPGAPAGPVAPGTPLVNVALSLPAVVDREELVASVSVPASDYLLRVPHTTGAAAASVRAAVFAERTARASVALEARLVYWSWVRARLERAVASSVVEQARAHVVDARALVDAGVATRAELLAVQAELARAELVLAQARSAADALEVELRTIMHDDGGAPLRIGEDPRAPLPELGATETALVREALARRPELGEVASRAHAAKTAGRLARAARYPRLDLLASATYASPAPGGMQQQSDFGAAWSAGAALTWSPTDLVAADAAVRGAEARAAAIEDERREIEDRVRRAVAQAARAVRDAQAASLAAARSLEAAEEEYRVRSELFRAGRSTATDLVDAQTRLTRSRLEVVAAAIAGRVGRAQLSHATGRDR